MSLTYKIASTTVRLAGVKKMFLKNKEEMLEYAKKEMQRRYLIYIRQRREPREKNTISLQER